MRMVFWLSVGIILAQKLALPAYLTWLSAAGWWGICCVRFVRGNKKFSGSNLWILLVIAGAASLGAYWLRIESDLSDLTVANRPASVLAQVVSVSDKTSFRRNLVVDIKGILLPEGIKIDRGRAMITRALSPGEAFEPELRVGDMIVVTARFRRPRSAANPGQFNYRHYLYRRGIGLTAYIEGHDDIRKLEDVGDGLLLLDIQDILLTEAGTRVRGLPWLYGKVEVLRRRLVASWQNCLTPRAHGLLAAMVLGDRHLLEPGLQEAFSRTGQAHLLSVSGLHMGFVVGGTWFLLRAIPCREIVRSMISILFAWLYALIVGGNPPAVRATITLTLYLLALAWGKGHDRLAATGWAAFLQLLANPSLVFDTSFQLSYGALLGILTLAPVLQRGVPLTNKGSPLLLKVVARILNLIIISVSAQLAIFPFIVYYFHEISIIGPLLSLITVPSAGLIIPLGLLGSMLGLAVDLSCLGSWMGALLAGLDQLVTWSAGWNWARVFLSAGSLMTWLVYYSVLTLGVWYLRQRAVCICLDIPVSIAGRCGRKTWLRGSLIVLCCLVLYPVAASRWRPLEITFLDVGQGDAIVIRTPSGRNVLIDGGGLPPSLAESSFDVGKDIVLPFLRQRGVRKLDLVVATHFHNDHTQGLGAVLGELPVNLLGDNGLLDGGFASQQYRKVLRGLPANRSIERVALRRGHYLSLAPGVELAVLYPVGEGSDGIPQHTLTRSLDQNNNSVVLKLITKEYSILFCGDIDKLAQMELVRYNALLQNGEKVASNHDLGEPPVNSFDLQDRFGISADFLKVPHHGSREALVYSFLGSVSPAQSVVSVGTNPFGHPAPEYLHALEVVTGSTPWRTDVVGSIRIRIWGNYVKIDAYHDHPPWCIGSRPVIQQWEMEIRRKGRVCCSLLENIGKQEVYR